MTRRRHRAGAAAASPGRSAIAPARGGWRSGWGPLRCCSVWARGPCELGWIAATVVGASSRGRGQSLAALVVAWLAWRRAPGGSSARGLPDRLEELGAWRQGR